MMHQQQPNKDDPAWERQPFRELAHQYALSSDSTDESDEDVTDLLPSPRLRPLSHSPIRSPLRSPRRLGSGVRATSTSSSARASSHSPLPRENDISPEARTLMANIEARLNLLAPFPQLATTHGTLMLGLSPTYREAFATTIDSIVAEGTRRHAWASLVQQHATVSFASLQAHRDGTRPSAFFTRHYDTQRAPFVHPPQPQPLSSSSSAGTDTDTDTSVNPACAICCFPLECSPNVCILQPCQHVFHSACFAEHVMKTESNGTSADLLLSKHERLARLCVRCCLCRATCKWSAFETESFQLDHAAHLAEA